MSTFPIDWHRDCVKNMREHLVRQKAELERLRANNERLEADIFLRERQIARALKLGRLEFDSNRLKVENVKIPLPVWGWTGRNSETGKQQRMCVATPTKAAAERIAGKRSRGFDYTKTGNDMELTVARANPGVVFGADEVGRDYKPVTPIVY